MSEEFLEHANGSERTFGNNKFQETIKELEEKLDVSTSECTQFKDLCAVYEDTISGLRSSIEDLKAHNAALSTELEQQKTALSTAMQKLESDKASASSHIESLQSKCNDLQQQLEAATKRETTGTTELQKANEHITELKTNVQQIHETMTRKDGLIRESNEAILLLQKEIDISNGIIGKLNDELEYHKKNIASLTSTKQDLEVQVESQGIEIRKLTEQVVIPTRSTTRAEGVMRRR